MNEDLLKNFHVIGVISNPVRYKSRYTLAKQFMDMMGKYAVNFHMVEVAFGDREFAISDTTNPNHYQFRTNTEIWHKESMINLAIQRLPNTWQYVAWVDMDISFTRQDVFTEAWQQLQHYSMIQLFSDCADLGPHNEIVQMHKGFCFIYAANRRVTKRYEFAHPGFAWAATRKAMETVGGLIEAPLGAGDHHMALALVGKGHLSLPGGIHENYRKMVLSWQEKATALKKNIGYVPGLILHYWHGKKKDRKYIERWEILTKNKFDPATHIKKDLQGLITLQDDCIDLRDDLRQYFRQRCEDSNDLE